MFTLFLLAAKPALTSDRAKAERAYDRAVTLRTALEARPEGTRPLAEYEKLVRAFQAVYRYDPAYRKAPAALASVGEVYEEMAREFSQPRYFKASIRAYRFLIAQYPQSGVARDALFTIAEIYRTDLRDLAAAREVYAKYLERYSGSSKASLAEQRVAQIDRVLSKAKVSSAQAASSDNTLRQEQAAAATEERGPNGERIPEVTSIHRWVGPDYTRIVIGVDDEVKFHVTRVKNPDRLVFDLKGARLSAALAGKTFPVDDGFLQGIRVGQFRPRVTRVVLDVAHIEDYSVFSLPNPFRLVIDIRGRPSGPTKSRLASAEFAAVPSERRAPAGVVTAGQPAGEAAKSESAPESTDVGAGHHAGSESGESRASENAPRSDRARSNDETAGEGATDSLADFGSESTVRPPGGAASAAPTLTRALGLKVGRVVIDPGHGGHDTGTIGPTGLCEKDLVLDVGLRLRKLIEHKLGSEVVMTRSDDTFVPLEERTAIANQKAADLFISIHANASRDESARGIETYYLNFTSDPSALEVAARENATSQESVHKLQKLIERIALSEKVQESRHFALQVQHSLYAQAERLAGNEQDRGVKKAPFVVLIGANMPSILTEISFLTNPRDERLLKRPAYRQKIAEALYNGIARYANTLGTVNVAAQAHPTHPSAAGSVRRRSALAAGGATTFAPEF